MEYKYYADFTPGIRALFKRGGPYQRAARTAEAVVGRITNGEPDPFKGIAFTKHGEKRIPKCRKYDLSGRCRLITVVDNGVCVLCFVGTHDASDA